MNLSFCFYLLHQLTSDRVTNKYPGGNPSNGVCRLKKLQYDEDINKFTDIFKHSNDYLIWYPTGLENR